jgi:hypothetical protein
MAPIVFSFARAAPLQGTTFIFGSWVCVANGVDGFFSHLDEGGGAVVASNPSPNQGFVVESESVFEPSETQHPAVRLGSEGPTPPSPVDELTA